MSNKPNSKRKKGATAATAWKRNRPEELELPSGNVCLAKPTGPEAMLASGIIPNSLMTIITNAIDKGKTGKVDEAFTEVELNELLTDPQKMQDIFILADSVCVASVIEPEVLPVPDSASTRDADALYVDEVDFEDKMFILNFAMGGTRALERFRAELEAGVGAVPASGATGGSPE